MIWGFPPVSIFKLSSYAPSDCHTYFSAFFSKGHFHFLQAFSRCSEFQTITCTDVHKCFGVGLFVCLFAFQGGLLGFFLDTCAVLTQAQACRSFRNARRERPNLNYLLNAETQIAHEIPKLQGSLAGHILPVSQTFSQCYPHAPMKLRLFDTSENISHVRSVVNEHMVQNN